MDWGRNFRGIGLCLLIFAESLGAAGSQATWSLAAEPSNADRLLLREPEVTDSVIRPNYQLTSGCDSAGVAPECDDLIFCKCTTCSCHPFWQPLDLCCDLADGWCESFAGSPSGCSGAPRQGWLATPDGFFTKEYHLFYGLTSNNGDSTDIHTGMFQLQYPLSRRIWVGLDVPFSSMVDRGPGLADLTDFDDVRVTGKILLHETRNLGLTAELGVRAPTGDEDMGGGITALTPACNWWTDVGGGWSCRGGVGVDVGTSGLPQNNSDADMLYALAFGRTITPHDDTPWGDFTYYLSVHGRSGIDGPEPHTYLFLGPGLRTHLGNNLFFLTALQVPVTGPSSYDQQLMLMLVKGL